VQRKPSDGSLGGNAIFRMALLAVSVSVCHTPSCHITGSLQVGDSKEPVRKGVRVLFGQLCCVYPPGKLFTYLVDGLKSKNARQRTGMCACLLFFVLFY